MNILAIGNSFSTDATRYLHGIAAADGFPMKVVNLYIGGCSLARHYRHMHNDDRAYALEFNGEPTGFAVSIREALQSDLWDCVTMQQASHLSIDDETYRPYLRALSEYVAFHAPKARQVFHRTWAYENGSRRLDAELGYATHAAMFADIKAASKRAADEAGIERIIPAGDLIELMAEAGLAPVYRDGYHLSLGAGRYAAALLWYGWLTGRSVGDDAFRAFDEDISEESARGIRRLGGELLRTLKAAGRLFS